MEIKRFGNIEGKTMMLLHGNLMCWQQFEDLIPLLERKFCVYAVSFDGFDGTGETTYTTARDQADKLAAYIEKELDGQLDLLFAESLGCGPAVFLKASPTVQIDRMILSGPEYLDFGVLNRLILKVMPQKQYRTAHEKYMPAWALRFMGQTEQGMQTMLRRIPDHISFESVRATWALSLSDGLSGTVRCKGRLLVRRKRRAHEKGHPAAADGISEPDRPLLPRFRPWRDHQSSGTACVGDGALSGRRRDSGRCAAESGKWNTMKVTTLDEKSIHDIGHAFGYYDYGEETGMSAAFSGKEATANYICAYVRGVLRGGFLHTTSERGEGYIAYKLPKEKMGLKTMWPIACGMLHNSTLKRLLQFGIAIKRGGASLQNRMDKEKKPYIFVGLVCVREEYQGQGYMRKVLELAFAEGDRLGVPVILETDAKSKCDKYVHLGMELAGTHDLGAFGKLYDLIKYPEPTDELLKEVLS